MPNPRPRTGGWLGLRRATHEPTKSAAPRQRPALGRSERGPALPGVSKDILVQTERGRRGVPLPPAQRRRRVREGRQERRPHLPPPAPPPAARFRGLGTAPLLAGGRQ